MNGGKRRASDKCSVAYPKSGKGLVSGQKRHARLPLQACQIQHNILTFVERSQTDGVPNIHLQTLKVKTHLSSAERRRSPPIKNRTP